MAFSVISQFILDIRLVYRGAELRRRYGLLGGTSLFNAFALDYIFIPVLPGGGV